MRRFSVPAINSVDTDTKAPPLKSTRSRPFSAVRSPVVDTDATGTAPHNETLSIKSTQSATVGRVSAPTPDFAPEASHFTHSTHAAKANDEGNSSIHRLKRETSQSSAASARMSIPHGRSAMSLKSHEEPPNGQQANARNSVSSLPNVVEVDFDELDDTFDKFFETVDKAHGTKRGQSGLVIDAGARALSDMWAVLSDSSKGMDLRGCDVVHLVRGNVAFKGKEEVSSIVVEYVTRLDTRIRRWLDMRQTSSRGSGDLPAVVEWLARVFYDLSAAIPGDCSKETDHDYDSVFKQASPRRRGSSFSETSPPACSVQWRLTLQKLVQKLVSDFEVSAIEELQGKMHPVSLWEGYVDKNCLLPLSSTHPPKLIGHPLNEEPEQKLWLTSWAPSFICEVEKLNLLEQWVVSCPKAAPLLAEHSTSAIVTAINSAFRVMRHRERKTAETVRKLGSLQSMAMDLFRHVKGEVAKKSKGNRSAKSSGHHEEGDPVRSSSSGSSLMDAKCMLAFANEAALMTTLCSKLKENLSESALVAPVYPSILEGLSENFSEICDKSCDSLASAHFIHAHRSTFNRCFAPKQLSTRLATPLAAEVLPLVTSFLEETVGPPEECSAHLSLVMMPLLDSLMEKVVQGYLQSLLKHKPRLDRFPRLPEVMAADESAFCELFGQLGITEEETYGAAESIARVRVCLLEPSRSMLVAHCMDGLCRSFGPHGALKAGRAVVEMRAGEWSKRQRHEVLEALKDGCALRAQDGGIARDEEEGSEGRQSCRSTPVQEKGDEEAKVRSRGRSRTIAL